MSGESLVPKRVAVYARVSTHDQEVENQLRELRHVAADKGWSVVGTFIDVGVKGDERKPELDRLLRNAHVGKIDLVAFWALDRLSRSGALDALQILDRLERQGVAYWSYREPYLDSSAPFHAALTAFIAEIAMFEKRRLAERVRVGMARARAEGRHVGRPPGMLDVENHRIVPYPVPAERLAAERAEGASWGALSRKYGIPKASVRRLCRKGLSENGEG